MKRRIILGLGVTTLVVMSVALAGEEEGFRRRWSNQKSLKEDAANTIFLAEVEVENLRSKLHEAEARLQQTRESLRPLVRRGSVPIRRTSVAQAKSEPKQEDAELKTEPKKESADARAEAERLVDRLEAEVELTQLVHDTDKALLQAAIAVLREARLTAKVEPNGANVEAEAEIKKMQDKFAAVENEFLQGTARLNAKKRELKAARQRIGE